MSDEPRFPDLHVQLTGTDGNAFAIMGAVSRVLPRELRDEFREEAMSGDYDNLLATCCRWVSVS
jgi:hypothetical protein